MVANGAATTRPWLRYITPQPGRFKVRTLYTARSLTLNMTQSWR